MQHYKDNPNDRYLQAPASVRTAKLLVVLPLDGRDSGISASRRDYARSIKDFAVLLTRLSGGLRIGASRIIGTRIESIPSGGINKNVGLVYIILKEFADFGLGPGISASRRL